MKLHLDTFTRRLKRNRFAAKKKNPGKVRLSVHRTGRHIYVQAIDDVARKTLASASSCEKTFKGKGWTVDGAKLVGKAFAERAKKAKVKDVYFDRGAYKYHGRIKALADALREGGLEF
ncbi:MAG: 50S ribosomal protein L18 [Rickettsiales bacterium]|jgi:large subunit ribosomal protein L18|nr:50S ribosomal protein L18 [Rickettsiales bacterium]